MFRLKEVDAPPASEWLVVILAACLAVLCGGSAWALGTPAGTIISSTATATYTLGSDPTLQTVSASHSFDVLEVIDLVLTWQDAAAVAVNTPQNDRALTFLLTNTGNGAEAFALFATDGLAGDDFDPVFQSLWLETNGIEGLQIADVAPDTLYQTGLNDPDLPADAAIRVYLLCNIPAELNDGAGGQVHLHAAATTAGAAGAAVGSVLPGFGLNGVDAVVGTSNADAESAGTYAVAGIGVSLIKSIRQIADPFDGSEPYAGARVTYRIVVQVAGSGTAEELVITDPVPAEMTFVPGSIVLDGVAQTDAADVPIDHSDFNVTGANTVAVSLGDKTAPAVHTIEFSTTINY